MSEAGNGDELLDLEAMMAEFEPKYGKATTSLGLLQNINYNN